jgi:phenylacetate-CoA ligase
MKHYFKETIKNLLRSRKLIHNEINLVEKLNSMNDTEIYQYKEEKFIKLFRHAIEKSKFYKEFYSHAGISYKDVQSLNDIKKLPVLTKDLLRKHYREILTVPRWKAFKSNTSGTTGTPLVVFKDYGAVRLEQAYIWVRRKSYGFMYGERLVSLRGVLGYNQFKMFVHATNTLYLSSYHINNEMAIQYYNEIQKFAPRAIEGYPSSLYNLCIALKEQNLKLNIPLTFTSSETLFDFQRFLITEVLGTKIYDWYGCTERTIALSEKTDNTGYMEEAGYSINEYDNEHILTTSLINNIFPLIRYKVDDIIDFEFTAGELKIYSVSGRKEDNIICKDRSHIGRLDHVFKGVKHLKLAQILQTKIGEIAVNVVPDDNFSISDEKLIIQNIHEKIGPDNIDIYMNRISEKDIIYTARNKFNLVVSKLVITEMEDAISISA